MIVGRANASQHDPRKETDVWQSLALLQKRGLRSLVPEKQQAPGSDHKKEHVGEHIESARDPCQRTLVRENVVTDAQGQAWRNAQHDTRRQNDSPKCRKTSGTIERSNLSEEIIHAVTCPTSLVVVSRAPRKSMRAHDQRLKSRLVAEDERPVTASEDYAFRRR